jgi:hypothetical protein
LEVRKFSVVTPPHSQQEGQNSALSWKKYGALSWDARNFVVIDFFPRKKTIDAIQCIQML